jgi:hypothetical protein
MPSHDATAEAEANLGFASGRHGKRGQGWLVCGTPEGD